jgi:hypothetical protein
MRGTYFRWTARQRVGSTQGVNVLQADILGADTDIVADPATGLVTVKVPDRPLDADEARMIGVRIIEAAALADNGRSVREP